MKLYDIAGDLRTALDSIEAARGEISKETEALLDQTQGKFADKAEAVACYIEELEKHEDTLRETARMLVAKARARANKVSWLKQYLLHNMQSTETFDIERPLKTVRVQASNPAIEEAPSVLAALLEIEARHQALPVHVPLGFTPEFTDSFVTLTAKARLNKGMILQALKADPDLHLPPGLTVREGHHIRIY